MDISRRRFLGSSAVAATSLAAGLPTVPAHADQIADQKTAAATPSLPVLALNRMAYGPHPRDLAELNRLGFAGYVDQQLNPASISDSDCDNRIAARGFQSLGKPLAQLWSEYHALPDYGARLRPLWEVRDAAWIRAIYSRRQLQEVLVEFWHNHFNVNGSAGSDIACVWPAYDRVIRTNAFGNFRTFLEAIATSPPMLFYLDNASSRDGPSNENYARELFELHTLGSDHYYNNLYNDVNQVPRYPDGRPMGYIDQDVYEAADCFTGWTVANGAWNDSGTFPNTGEFLYHHPWHDDRPTKIVLSQDGRPNIRDATSHMADGRKVLDLLADHPATARHICTKLCRRLVADNPPPSVVDRAVAAWNASKTSPDQIKQVVRAILLSPEFAATWGAKVKRPFEHTVSFLRATGAEFVPNDGFHWHMGNTGYRMFEWPTPTGHPDTADAWLSSNVLLRQWNMPVFLFFGWVQGATFDLHAQIPGNATTSAQIVDVWIDRLLGRALDAADRNRLIDLLRQNKGANEPPQYYDDNDRRERMMTLVTTIAMMPAFLQR